MNTHRELTRSTRTPRRRPIRFHNVVGSHLHSIGWSRGNLEVNFRDGTRYRYDDVPIGIYRRLLRAESKGGFLHREIKLRGFSYQELQNA